MEATKKLRLGVSVVAVTGLILGAFFAGGNESPQGPVGDGPAVSLSGSQALLYGRVLDADTDEPLATATLRIDHAGGTLEVATDTGGRYQAVVDTSRPLAVTIAAPGYKGGAAFGNLCPGDRRAFSVSLPPQSAAAPLPPLTIPGPKRCP